MDINYIFHIGERCQHLAFLKENNLLSGYNCMSGLYISFESSLALIKNDCLDLTYNNAIFTISKKNVDGIKFIKCNNFSESEIKNIESLLIDNPMFFFNAENYYKNSDYSINLKYTDLSNLSITDMYDWENKYCVMPNADYSSDILLETVERRKDRFISCLQENTDNVLLIYINKSILDSSCNDKILYISKIYDLSYNLFYVLPVYCQDENEKKLNEETIVIRNITFFIVYFPSIKIQKITNPNDDNNLSFIDQYDKIKIAILNTYNIDLKILY